MISDVEERIRRLQEDAVIARLTAGNAVLQHVRWDFISTCMSVVGGYLKYSSVNVTQKCMTGLHRLMYLYVLTLWICHNSSREFLKEEKVQRL